MKGIVITTENEMYLANFTDFFQIAEKMGWITTERVKTWGFGRMPYILIVDDDGRLREKPKLNNLASLLYGYLVHKTPIVGDVVIMKDGIDADGQPNILGLDDGEAANLQKMICHVWNVEWKEDVDYTK